jgi:phosphate acetyltransferase
MSLKKKNVTLGYQRMEDGSYFGTMMVYKGHADGMVSSRHTTQHTILPALQFIKTNQIHQFSSIFYVFRRPSFCFWDCALIQILLQNNWQK